LLGSNVPGRRRTSCCIPQKQPPARIARSVVVAIVRPPALQRALRTRRTLRSLVGHGG
jgi:hypothetical protein